MELKLNAYAKVNLSLEVLFRRSDGYHELRSVMHAVDLFDEVALRPSRHVEVFCPGVAGENAAKKAAALYLAHYPGCGACIEIQKHIPMEAGLGGASADAAAVLLGLNRLYGRAAQDALFAMALETGADVPFCLLGGCALAEGIGERLTPLPRQDLSLLIVKGEEGVSTGALFSSLALPLPCMPVLEMAKLCMAQDSPKVARLMGNALEGPAAELLPKIALFRGRMMEKGALGACMSGSGSVVVGAFASLADAENAAAAFLDAVFVHVCRTV